MSKIKIRIGDNPTPFEWSEIIRAIYHNLGDKAAKPVIQFAIDIKAVSDQLYFTRPDYETGLLVDAALYAEIASNYPEEDSDELGELVFFRAFCWETTDVEVISRFIADLFDDAPLYIWVNGKMVGGLCFPQLPKEEDDRPPLSEQLSSAVCFSPSDD